MPPKKKTTTKKKSKSKVNEAGNYTKPSLRKRLFNEIKSSSKGGRSGQWSARKAQMLAKRYKDAGGGYKLMALKKSQKSLKKWTKQKWRTPSGKKSSDTGEVYAPSATIKKLKSTKAGRAKLAAANKKKRAATKKGKQHAKHGLHKGKKR